MIDDLIEDLKTDEGWRPYVYDDETGEAIVKGSTVEGYPTIGWGFLVDVHKGGELPKHIGEMWLSYAVTQRWNELVLRIPWAIDQPEDVQRALGNMAYQMGATGVIGFQKMLAALLDSDRELAADEALDSKWAQQTPNRANRIADLIRG